MFRLSGPEDSKPLIDSSTSEYELQSINSQSADVKKSTRQALLFGWRVGAIASASTATIVLIINITVTTVCFVRFGFNGGTAILSEGSCNGVKNLDRWMHLGINAISTILLCCSNYCMQSISSPTRGELVRAHKNRTWLHIGIQSFRNLRHISRERVILWLLLLISSLPLHLLFNSMVYASLQANDYTVLPVTKAFLSGPNLGSSNVWNTSGLISVPANTSSSIVTAASNFRSIFDNTRNYTNKSTEDCFHAYTSQYVSNVGDVILVQEDNVVWRDQYSWQVLWHNDSNYEWIDSASKNWTNSSLSIRARDVIPFKSNPATYPAYGWMCPSRSISDCSLSRRAEVPVISSWAPYGSPVVYCLVETVEESCKLQYSLAIALAVIICNATKAACMIYIICRCRDTYLVTIGDAIAVFLDDPDPDYKNRCLYGLRLSYKDRFAWMEMHGYSTHAVFKLEPKVYKSHRTSWARAPTKARWLMTYILASIALIVATIYINSSLHAIGMPSNMKALWGTGIGVLNGNNLLSMQTSVIGGAILANTPQALLSYLYLLFNGLLTCMLVTKEWSQYYLTKGPLRVTNPKGVQKSTYWLQIPFRYSIPLTIASFILHWLASQSLFMVVIEVFDDSSPRVLNSQISTLGFSPVAIILTTTVGSLILIGGALLACRKYPAGMPLAGSYSNFIAAACHPPKDDTNASVRLVQWGVVQADGNSAASDSSVARKNHEKDEFDQGYVGHCSFTSFDVTAPVEGRRYW